MYGQVSQRLNEGAAAGGPTFYPTLEIVAAINEASRLFCLLTLALETTVAWNAAAATTFFHMLTIYADWIVPLRITSTAGAKVRPARFTDLWALDSQWPASPGNPYRYAHAGSDLLALYQQPAGGAALNVTYAQAPEVLVADGDIPATPAEYHPSYVDYGIYRCRQAEGGDALAAALPLLENFLAAAGKYADYVRARNIGQGYDRAPFELDNFDRSLLVGMKKRRKS
jgi:hypothetical protein